MPAGVRHAHPVTMADIPPRTLRVSDADRATTAKALADALTEGRLSTDEADERLAACWAAKYEHELAELVADLPRPAPEPTATRTTNWVWSGPLRTHVAIAALLSTMLIARWAFVPEIPRHDGFGGPPPNFFWPIIPMFWLALSVLVHYRVRARRPLIR
jgi:hypothetical protein